ncbi:hypothetical protein G3578_12640 [Brevibacillus sp. SYP-B805]|uniref:hypothetical protein n=1 Tax=Brevibacillus sp. SYP-B805 TaxID=1578199 RepID=UPI0013EA35B7|nr:hypothetical protein [Brevibacillus sp. SYP-B805]NGQ96005.1 hypothetical protein [Brevibacillus sp. SYP-B805]
MDIGKLLNAAKSIPKEKLKTDAGLKEVIRDLAKKGGKNLSDKELDGYLAQFRRMQRTESVGSMLDKLAKKGVNPDDLSAIKKKFKK